MMIDEDDDGDDGDDGDDDDIQIFLNSPNILQANLIHILVVMNCALCTQIHHFA